MSENGAVFSYITNIWLLLVLSSVFPCPVSAMTITICMYTIPTVAQRCIWSTSVYCILDSVYYFLYYCNNSWFRLFSASTHCLEGFTLLCIVTPN